MESRSSIRQVAARAGVSHVTVVNILRGRGSRASEETRERVMEAVRELNYVPIAQPQTQRRHIETRIIGLVFDQFNIEESLFGLSTFRGLREGAREHNYDLLTLCRDEPTWALGGEELQFLDRRCDGFIFVGPYKRREVFDAITRYGIPLVSCFNADVPDAVPIVQPDDEEAMRLAVEHLRAKGHRKIAHLAGPESHSDARQRRVAFERCAARLGFKQPYIQTGRGGAWWPNSDEMSELLRQDVTGVVCINDSQALELWDVAEKQGVRVPRDLSLIGVDSIPEAQERGLSSIGYSPTEIGRLAMDSLVALINQEEEAQLSHRVPVHLVERESVIALEAVKPQRLSARAAI